MNTLVITGQTTKSGKYGFYNLGQLEAFAKSNPDKNLIVTIQVEDKKSKNGLLAYYHAKIIPSWIVGFYKLGIIKNSIEVDVYLRGLWPVTQKKSLSELSYQELKDFHNEIKDVSLSDIHTFIESAEVL